MSLASCLGEKDDFQCTDRRGLTVQNEVLVRPSNYIIPASLRKLLTTGNVESEGHTEATRHYLAPVNSDQDIVKILVEQWCGEVEGSDRIVQHVFRPHRKKSR